MLFYEENCFGMTQVVVIQLVVIVQLCADKKIIKQRQKFLKNLKESFSWAQKIVKNIDSQFDQ